VYDSQNGVVMTLRIDTTQLKKGFSLIELSIVLTVFAVIAVGMLSGREAKQENIQVTSVENTLQHVQEALAFYVKHHGYLPCPASRTDTPDSATFGVSVSCAAATATAAPAGTANIGTSTDEYQLRVGMIPTRTLGIPDRYALDSWGNRLSYVIIRSLGVDKATYDAYAPTQTSDYFQIVDKTGAVLYGNNNTQIVKYVLLSHGSDGSGAYSKTGTQALTCPDHGKDRKNCEGAKQFVIDHINQTDTGSNYYNDYAKWEKVESTPPAAPAPASLMNISQTVWVGENDTCIVLDDDSVQCAGNNTDGVHGVGDYSSSYTFRPIAGGYQFSSIGHGDNSSMSGITNTGHALAWGRNNTDQLGRGPSAGDTSSPADIFGAFSDWTNVTTDSNNGCGVRGGIAYCWGVNPDGNLGDGTTTDSNVPVLVAGVYTDWVSVSSGGGITAGSTTYPVSCGLRANGRIYCWGEGESGQLGNNTWVSSTTPTEVAKEDGTLPGYDDWSYLRFNGSAVCGIRAEGLLYCWGRNWRSQLWRLFTHST
jgi:prepilin-type N-terminal cleavage/methylation domain-containing protein